MAKDKYIPKHAEEMPEEKAKPQRKEKPEKPKMTKKNRVILIVAVLLVILIGYGISAIGLKKQASAIKADVKTTAACVRKGDIDGAEKAWSSAEAGSKKAYKKLSRPAWRIAGAVPFFGTDIKSARTLLGVAVDASETLVKPGLELCRDYPLKDIKTDDGFNVGIISKYLSLLTENGKYLDEYATKLQTLKFRFVKFGNSDLVNNISRYATLFKNNEKLLNLFEFILGDGEDRYYIIPAQNMSEIRASGGFPGSVGYMRIKDGILKIGDFKPINEVIYYAPLSPVAPTQDEYRIFSGNLRFARDACYLPDFERCGEIWAKSYEYKTGTPHVDGAISLTPTIIQDILSVTGKTLTLSDGTKANGENATRVIQHDIYMKYFKKGAYATQTANDITDAIFAETAQSALELATSDFSISHGMEYLAFIEKGFKDRTIMMWFDDDEAQELCREIGCSGNIDAGVFFSCSVASKLGWFFEMTTDMKDMGDNKYEVTVTLKNTMSDEELNSVSTYISGYTYGNINGYLHLVAPKGGTISDITASNGTTFTADKYHDFDLYYTQSLPIKRGETVTVKYTITSKGPFELVSTPTLTDYK